MSDFILYTGVFAAGWACCYWRDKLASGATALIEKMRAKKVSSPPTSPASPPPPAQG